MGMELVKLFHISIHVPRVGDDHGALPLAYVDCIISIHVPRVGDDLYLATRRLAIAEFLSTSPAWGTTRPVY